MPKEEAKTALISHYFDEIFARSTSISDAIERMQQQGNVAFFEANKGVLREKFKQSSFAAQSWKHEIMHLTGRFSHTPYGEQFAVLAQTSFEQWDHPISKVLSQFKKLEENAPVFKSDGSIYNTKESFYYAPEMAAKRQIKDWQAVYACAVGVWVGFKISEHMKHMGNSKPENSAEDAQKTARLLQNQSLNNIQHMTFSPYVEKALDDLPASLLQLSKAENKILLSIAKDGLCWYADNKNLDYLPQEARGFESRIELTLQKLHNLIYENIHASPEQQYAYFSEMHEEHLQPEY